MQRTRALQEDITSLTSDVKSLAGTVEGMKTKEGVRKGVILGAGAVSGLAGGTVGAKILAALLGSMAK